MGGPDRRELQHRQREVDGQNSRKAFREQTRITADTAANLHRKTDGRVDWTEPAQECIHHDGRPLRGGSRVPLTREAIEVALDVLAQVAGPPIGIESRRSPRGHAHRVVGTTRTGGSMTFDR
jgi:hypothetical protein